MAQLVDDQLTAFLRAYADLPWTPGGIVDCCLVLAEWAIWLGYPDPAAGWRGSYRPGQDQIDTLSRWGGALPLISGCAAVINAVPTDRPFRGCVGVVGSAGNVTRQFGAIHDGDGWITRKPDGFGRITARTLAAWKL